MANNYFSKQSPTDISLQSEDGGGLTLTKNGKFLFGAKLQEITNELNETSFDGVVDINPNTNSSYIGIMNADSEPVDVDIPNSNQYSLFTPQDNNIVFTNPLQDECDDVFDAVLVGGLDDTSRGYKTISDQLEIFKKGYGTDKNVKAFPWSTPVATITSFLKDHPKVPVIMFSKGCEYADKIAAVKGINKNRIYIVEPWAVGAGTKKIVQDAVASGVPPENVYVGPNTSVGKGVISNPSDTNFKGTRTSHWDALKIVGEVMKENIKCNTQPTPTPTPTPIPTTPPPTTTPPVVTETENVEEGIYEANFLPATENDGFQLFDSGYGDTCSEAAAASLNDIYPSVITTLSLSGGGLPPDLTTADLVRDLNQYVKFSNQAWDDWINGIINYNTVLDLIAIAKATQLKIYVGTARSGHSCKTTSGNISRHMKGEGLDLPGFYDLTGTIAPADKLITDSKANVAADGTPDVDSKTPYTPVSSIFKALADKFVASAVTLPNAGRGEGANKRGVLWYFNNRSKGGNHFNHVHYSNNIPHPEWFIKTIPSSFNCDCNQIRNARLTAQNCT
jgi:hypothetical protein